MVCRRNLVLAVSLISPACRRNFLGLSPNLRRNFCFCLGFPPSRILCLNVGFEPSLSLEPNFSLNTLCVSKFQQNKLINSVKLLLKTWFDNNFTNNTKRFSVEFNWLILSQTRFLSWRRGFIFPKSTVGQMSDYMILALGVELKRGLRKATGSDSSGRQGVVGWDASPKV